MVILFMSWLSLLSCFGFSAYIAPAPKSAKQDPSLFQNITVRNGLPTYCIDSTAFSIFQRRLKCLRGGTVAAELALLRTESSNEYMRSNELHAYEFFVNTQNKMRVESCSQAEFEYVPLLPLNWRVGKLDAPKECSYASLIEDIVSYVKYVKEVRKVDMQSGPLRFVVASTFNMRTAMGTGMPTQIRRGTIYDTVTQFVTSVHIGHYERYPQCPDLLRKSWKYVVEIPYLPIDSDILDIKAFTELNRATNFFFAGRLLLWGPERVCSVRNAIGSIAGVADVVVVNITEQEANGPVEPKLFKQMQSSVFCIVAKADSYSTASFYSALAAGCIPIVISDWFVFSFPWAIPYSQFTIRILENDFIKDPEGCLKAIRAQYSTAKLEAMRREIHAWLGLLSFQTLDINTLQYKSLQSMYNDSTITPPSTAPLMTSTTANALSMKSILPLEMMLLEMRYAQRPELERAIVPCISPFACTKEGRTLHEVALSVKNFVKETRSHLCQHAPRLIGYYKIVYFMQCVRILWPLEPGKLKPVDTKPGGGLDPRDKEFMMNFHALTNISKAGKWTYVTHPISPNEVKVKTLNRLKG